MLVDRYGNQIQSCAGRSKWSYALDGVAVKMWSAELKKEADRKSCFDKFIGVTLYDQFVYPLQHLRLAKGNVIKINSEG